MIMSQTKLLKQRGLIKTNFMRKVTLSALIVMSSTSQAIAYSKDKNWPCIQGKVIKLSAGKMWRGDPVDENDLSWKQNQEVRQLVKKILPRRVTLKETEKIIEEFAKKHNGNRKKQLEQSFLSLLSETNKIRQEIISGIGKFSSRQKSLSKRIIETRRKINDFEQKDTDGTLTKEEDKEFAKLEQQQEWDIRIRDEREKSLEYVCESPVLLEQRLFALSQQL